MIEQLSLLPAEVVDLDNTAEQIAANARRVEYDTRTADRWREEMNLVPPQDNALAWINCARVALGLATKDSTI